MRPLDSETREFLERLHLRWLHRRAHPVRQDAGPEGLGQISGIREPAAVPYLIDLLRVGDAATKQVAAQTIQQIVAACVPLTLAELDDAVRVMPEYRWPSIDPRDVAHLSCGLTGTLGVLSFSPSGYVREAAVRSLAQVQDGSELPFLLIRLNDWVRPVRELTRRVVVQRIRHEYAAHFSRNLPLVFRLEGQGRDDHRPLAGAVLELLRSTGGRPELLRVMRAGDRPTRRLAFRLLIEGAHGDQTPVLEEAMEADDTLVRLWAAQTLRQRLVGPQLREVLARMKSDRFMPVRREALYGFLEKLLDLVAAELRAALLDPHRSIREFARFYLQQSGGTDFATFYREHLAETGRQQLAAAIAGLGETGSTGDTEMLAPFLDHPQNRVRRAAVVALGRLDPERFVGRMLIALDDQAAGVTAAARDVLERHLFLIAPENLWAIFQQAKLPHVKRAVLRLIAQLTWWESARLLVTAAGSEDEEVHAQAIEHLHRWHRNYHRLASKPTAEQLRGLQETARRYGDRLDEASARDLDSLVSYAERELR